MVGGQRHAPAALPRQRPSTHCIGGWVGPRPVRTVVHPVTALDDYIVFTFCQAERVTIMPTFINIRPAILQVKHAYMKTS